MARHSSYSRVTTQDEAVPKMRYSFFVKFDKDLQPTRIVVGSWEELESWLNKMVRERGEIYEWIIRDYAR